MLRRLASSQECYQIKNSLMLDSASSQYLRRDGAIINDANGTEISFWIKRGKLGAQQVLYAAFTNGGLGDWNNHNETLYITANDQIGLYYINSGIVSMNVVFAPVLRDPTAWYHIYLVKNASTSDVYINGVKAPVASGTLTGNGYIAANNAFTMIGSNYDYGQVFDGYITELYRVSRSYDKQAVTSFGRVCNQCAGKWEPIKYKGTYGTYGFKLEFQNAAALGADTSPNGNNWTLNGAIVAANQTVDTPTNNYAVLNALYTGKSTLSKGNLTASGTTDIPTIIPNSGTWYFEIDGVSKTWAAGTSFPTAAGTYNFGQRAFNNTPTYPKLCTRNLPTPIIKIAENYFKAITYTGNGSTQQVRNVLAHNVFTPDLAIIKSRSATTKWGWFDSVRGVSKCLSSNSTAAETTDVNSLTSFDLGGISIGNSSDFNTLNAAYIAYLFKKGVVPGMDIVKVTKTGSSVQAFNHSLGVAPSFMIAKHLTDTTPGWNVWTPYNVQNGYVLLLNSSAAAVNAPTAFNSAVPTSSQFTLGTMWSAGEIVVYLFAEVPGLSKMGSFTGNATADNAFVYCGFKPALVMARRTDADCQWLMFDNKRAGYNVDNDALYVNGTNAEVTTDYLDFVSNGFKIRNATITGLWTFIAFAEIPTKFSLSR